MSVLNQNINYHQFLSFLCLDVLGWRAGEFHLMLTITIIFYFIQIYKKLSGSTIGGIDIYPYTNVGIVNHLTLHDLRLQNGHEYFASVKGSIISISVLH